MIARNFRKQHRVVCVTDMSEGITCDTHPIWDDCNNMVNPNGAHFPSCYRRLKIFSCETLHEMGIARGDKVFSMDLDIVITGDISEMIGRWEEEHFVGWRGVGSVNPVVYNGSLFMFTAGTMEWLWTKFDPIESPLAAHKAKYFGSDQGWLSYSLNGSVPGWDMPEVMSYSRDMHRVRRLTKATKIVSFNGKKKPWDAEVQRSDPWIKEHYQ